MPRRREWTCSCGCRNYMTRRQCRMCHQPAPPAFWECVCGENNYQYRTKCRICDQPPPSQPASEAGDVTPDPTEEVVTVGNCTICMTNLSTRAVVPCGHLCVCGPCSKRISNQCPVCRGHANSIIRIFIT